MAKKLLGDDVDVFETTDRLFSGVEEKPKFFSPSVAVSVCFGVGDGDDASDAVVDGDWPNGAGACR